MLRRQWLGLMAAAVAAAGQKNKFPSTSDTVIAGATRDTTPRVGIVLSSFSGSEDHDGAKVEGLHHPCSPDASATDELLDEMTRKAIGLGAARYGRLSRIVGREDWVVVKPHIAVCRGPDGRLLPGSVTDPRVVRSVIEWLAEQRRGSRITIAEAPSWTKTPAFDVWESDWDGVFGKTSYRRMIEELGRKHPSVQFDIVDLTRDETMEVQPPVWLPGSHQAPLIYEVPATLVECDKLITVAPLSTSSRAVVSLTLGSYLSMLRSTRQEALRKKAAPAEGFDELLVGLFSVRPADYAILGGEWGLEGDGPCGRDAGPVHHTLVLGGANAVAVDAVGAAVMGFDPAQVGHLQLAFRRGFGVIDTDSIWIRGNEIDEAKRPFRHAAGLQPGA